MGAIRYSNNASGTLAISVGPADASITLGAGQGAFFPTIGAGQYALVTLEDVNGVIEIVKAITRTGDVMNIERAQEGTIAAAFASGSRVEVRVTAASLDNFMQKSGDTLPGVYDMIGGTLKNGQLVGTVMRGEPGVSTNEIKVPSGGAAPTIGGNTIYHTGNLTPAAMINLIFPVGTILLFKGSLNMIPPGFQLCDGTNNTPDLRGKFVIGAGGDYTIDSIGGSKTSTTGGAGAHNHGGVGEHVLTIEEMPEHGHDIWAANNSGDSNADGWLNKAQMGIPGEDVGPFGWRAANMNGDKLVRLVGGGKGHTHPLAAEAPEHSHSIDMLPPYRGLFYIMKV